MRHPVGHRLAALVLVLVLVLVLLLVYVEEMLRAPHRSWIAITFLTASLALGCGKSKSAGEAKIDRGALRVFPADSEFLGGISGPELRKSRHFDKLATRLPGGAATTLARFKECGIDLLGSLSSAMVAGKMGDQSGMIQVKGFYRTDFKMCDGVEGIQIRDDGAVTTITAKDNRQYLGWVGEDVFLSGPNLPAAAITERITAKSGVEGNEAVMKLLAKVDTDAAVWMVFAPTGGKMPVPMVGDLGGVFASAWVDGGLKLDLGVRMSSESSAQRLVKLARQGLPQAAQELGELGKFAANVKVKGEGSYVIFEIRLTDDELVALIEAARKDPRIEMMMGMMRQ